MIHGLLVLPGLYLAALYTYFILPLTLPLDALISAIMGWL